MSEHRFNIDATWWVLPSTPGSKYAHAPTWSVHHGDTPQPEEFLERSQEA